ncbi:FGGY-family carbohydrate kinase [Allorhizobium borbori]|uniref:L-xylulokinase n=1 Tax=Allorhizobium borbori TaxID=485907 RepID=A0A7W6K635_9HYPH|nr:FGGY-family carbohydrate kinase [Allorhizobium borbori]MBB4104971.1 L-xylulokinase [Allorhizobium borbori]
MGDLFLAIDAGGTAVKAAVFDANGQLVASRAVDVVTIHRDNGWVERDPEAFWRNTAVAIRELTATVIDPARVAAIACTGFGNGIFLVDEQGNGTRDGIVSVDHRAQSIVDEFHRDGTAADMEAFSGHRIWGGQTIMQLIWLARNEPRVVEKTRWALACKDYIRMRLTGVAASDPTDASGGGLLDLTSGAYDPAYFERLGIGIFNERMPPLVENTGIAGQISPTAATETGLLAGTPVVSAMMDVSACVMGSGVIGSNALTMIAGTWSINAIETDRTVRENPPILNMLHRDRACRLLADGSPTSAANLSWYLAQAAGGAIDVALANALVAASPVTGRRCHFMPFVNGPAPRRGAFVGLVNSDDRGSMLRALYEGVAFQHRRHGETVVNYVAPHRPSIIRLAGGASKSRVWSQIFADICGMPVEVSEGDELGALGAAMCAAVATGHYADLAAAARGMCRVTRTAMPDEAVRPFYEDRYREFLTLDQKLADLF